MGPHSHARKRVRHQVSAVTPNVSPSLLSNNIAGSSVLASSPSQELVIGGHSVHLRGETGDWSRRQGTIDILPEEVLLEIFEIDVVNGDHDEHRRWHILVHICRRWRSVVFASAHRLNLQLRCTYKTPVRKTLDVWPALPIIIEDGGYRVSRVNGAGDIIAALGHRDRVRSIKLQILNSVLNRFTMAMKEPFPELKHLDLRSIRSNLVLVLSDSFLSGYAPRLQTLQLHGISFPAIPKLLSSASDLVELRLSDIPHSGYISPEAMITGLSALTRLEQLHITFVSPRSRPDQPSPPRSIRTVLPALKRFLFLGVSEYLEDLTSRIDAPRLSVLDIIFFNQLIFNTPRLFSFISHVEKLTSQNQTQMEFSGHSVRFSHATPGHLYLRILCKPSDWQLSSLTQFCDSPFLSLLNLERLEICEDSHFRPHWQEDVENAQWLELLIPFINVKRLSLSEEFTPRVMPALLELSGERIMEVLPALQIIFLSESSLSGPAKKALAQFLTARQLSGHPVAVNPRGQE